MGFWGSLRSMEGLPNWAELSKEVEQLLWSNVVATSITVSWEGFGGPQVARSAKVPQVLDEQSSAAMVSGPDATHRRQRTRLGRGGQKHRARDARPQNSPVDFGGKFPAATTHLLDDFGDDDGDSG